MKRIWLDFQRPAPKSGSVPWLLLAAGLLAASAVLGSHLETQDAISELEYRIERKQRAIERSSPTSPKDMQDRGGPVRPLAKNSFERWERLFTALEQATDETVTLLALDPGESEISLSGEAKHFAAATAYVKRLESTGALTDVHVLSHEVAKDHPQRPIRFVLSARWKSES